MHGFRGMHRNGARSGSGASSSSLWHNALLFQRLMARILLFHPSFSGRELAFDNLDKP